MELIDILDAEGNPTGQTKTRTEAHKAEDWHALAHVWIVNSKGEILLQRRSPQVDFSPGLWDVAVGGHLSAGDTAKQGAVRELKEELGIEARPEDLHLVFRFSQKMALKDGTPHFGWFNVFLLKHDCDPASLTLQPEEVSEVKFFTLEEFQRLFNQHPDQFVSRDEEYELILSLLGKE